MSFRKFSRRIPGKRMGKVALDIWGLQMWDPKLKQAEDIRLVSLILVPSVRGCPGSGIAMTFSASVFRPNGSGNDVAACAHCGLAFLCVLRRFWICLPEGQMKLVALEASCWKARAGGAKTIGEWCKP